MAKEYDLVVIGGGVGGYTGAIKAAKLGLNVALVEKDLLGGTCLNRGCIPTKSYLKSASVVREVAEASEFGLNINSDYQIDFQRIKNRKDEIVKKLRDGVAYLIKTNKIDYFEGEGSVLGTSIFTPKSGSVMIKPNDGTDEIVITPKNVLIATGSRPTGLPNIAVDEKNILSSTGILELGDLPKSITIIGGGVIGVEWASLLTDLGTDVTLVEFMDRLIINENPQTSKILLKELEKRQVKVHLKTAVQSVEEVTDGMKITAKNEQAEIVINSEKVLVAVGRKPNVENIGLEAAGVEFDKKGIKVNEFYQTSAENIYAVGDVIDTLQLAHVAAKEAELAVETIAGEEIAELNYQNIPRGIYTYPEIASVGNVDGNTNVAESALKGKFDWQFNGKSMIENQNVGHVEVFADSETDDFIGLSIVGGHATDLISEGSLALYLNASPWEIGQTIHPHPSQSEAIMEANNDIFGMAINK